MIIIEMQYGYTHLMSTRTTKQVTQFRYISKPVELSVIVKRLT